MRSPFLHRVILLLLHHLRLRLPTLVDIRDLLLSLLFLRHGLRPRTLRLSSLSAISLIRVWAPPRPTSKPALLLVHGFGGDSRWTWHPQVAGLARRFDLYVPDLVFFGGSRSDGAGRSVAFQAQCLAEAMGELGVERYAVVGISYGGFVAYRMAAAEAAGAVGKAVVMTSVAGAAAAAEVREMVQREGRDVTDMLLPRTPEALRALVRRSMHRPPPWMPDFFLRGFIQLMCTDQRKERAELLTELLDKGTGINPLPILTQETLIIWGDKDKVFHIDYAYKLQRHLGDKSRLEIIKDAGHALHLEKPDQVNRLIESFLLDENAGKSS